MECQTKFMKDYKQLLHDCEEKDEEEVKLTVDNAERTTRKKKKKIKYTDIFETKPRK